MTEKLVSDESVPPSPDAEASRKGGRPGITRQAVADVVETSVARTGQVPSIREIRVALGGTGSLSTLSRFRREVTSQRLLAGASPDRGSPEALLVQASKSALDLLAKEAASAAEDLVTVAHQEAGARVAAAEGLQTRAEIRAAAAEKACENALGRASALEERDAENRTEIDQLRSDGIAVIEREIIGRQTIASLELTLHAEQTEHSRLDAERQANRSCIDALTNAVSTERKRHDAFEKTVVKRNSELDAATETITRLDAALDQAEQRAKVADKNARVAVDARANLETTNSVLTGEVRLLEQRLVKAETLETEIRRQGEEHRVALLTTLAKHEDKFRSLEEARTKAEARALCAEQERDVLAVQQSERKSLETLLSTLIRPVKSIPASSDQ